MYLHHIGVWGPVFVPEKIYGVVFRAVTQVEIQDTDGHAAPEPGIIFPLIRLRRKDLCKIKHLPFVPVGAGLYLDFNINFDIIVKLNQHIQNPLLLAAVPLPQKRIQQPGGAYFLHWYFQYIA